MPHAAASSPAVSGRAGLSEHTSFNFALAKVISIAIVVFSHWLEKSFIWILSTYGLFVFAFSSAYFTSKIYGDEVDTARFWRRKLERLGLRFWIILTFVALVAAAQGKVIWHWHSLLHFAGLSGVLNWVDVHNESALGNGLWFFTLLLGFYLAYPLLARCCRSNNGALLTAVLATAVLLGLRETTHIGHELWLTSLGFVLGVAYGQQQFRVPPKLALAGALFACVALGALNAGGVRALNTPLIALAAVAWVLWLANDRIVPRAPFVALVRLDRLLLEVFVIHTYLFIHLTGTGWIDLLLSVALIVITALGLDLLGQRLAALVFGNGRRPAQRLPSAR